MFGDFNILHNADALAVAAVVSNMRYPQEVAANAALIAAAHDGYAANVLTVDALATEYSLPDDAGDDYIYDTLGSTLSSAYFAARNAIRRATNTTNEG